MNKFKGITLIIVLAIGLAIAMDGFFIVNEEEQVIITQFGKPIGESITSPGLHFKVPVIQNANFFDKRYLEWDGDRNQIPTKDKKFIFVDSYARWQINDPLQFFRRLQNERGAQSRLDDILDGETRSVIASNDLRELVRSTNRTPDRSGTISEVIDDTLRDISVGRDSIQIRVQNLANQRAQDLGIKILDFRFKRINYVEDVRRTVYNRMISERNRIADKFRSEGEGEASRINGDKERALKEIQSEAFREAEEIRGQADAEAANIYANAYNKNGAARDLYKFTRTLEAFSKTIDDKTYIVLSTESDFYKYLKEY
ncbi:MAG: protease modulator HflC [Bacteroidota bacterium]